MECHVKGVGELFAHLFTFSPTITKQPASRRSSSRLQELSAAVTMELLYFYALAHQTSFDVRWLKKGTVAWICFAFFFVIFVTDWDLPWVNHHHEVNPPFWEKIFCPTFFHPHYFNQQI